MNGKTALAMSAIEYLKYDWMLNDQKYTRQLSADFHKYDDVCGGGTALLSLSRLLDDASGIACVVASRNQDRRAHHKRHHIYGRQH